MPKHPYAGKTVLITGAARGIGKETARRLHAGGAKLALVGLEPELLEALSDELGGDRTGWWEADVTSVGQLQSAVDGAVQRFGGLDIVIANAGVHYVGAFESAPLSQIERELEINLFGVIRTDHVVLPHLVKSGGYLLNIASLAAISHAPLMTAYAASKAGVEGFTNALRQEAGARGVSVGCAYFGFIDTDLVRDAFSQSSTGAMDRLMPKFVRTAVSVDQAVDAIEQGILGRKDRVWAPRFVGGALTSRGILQPLAEKRVLASKKTLRKALELAREDAAKAQAKVTAGREAKASPASETSASAKAKTSA